MLSVNDYTKPTKHPFGMLENLKHASEKEAFMAWCLIQCIEAENLDVDIKTSCNEDYMCENPIGLLSKTGKQTYRLTIKAKGLLYAYYGKHIGTGTPAEDRYGREPFKKGVMQVCNGCVFQNKAVVGNCVSPITCKHESNKMKPLAQYLDEYIEHEYNEGNIKEGVGVLYAWDSWRELLEQAFDAYESTENVKIRIERV